MIEYVNEAREVKMKTKFKEQYNIVAKRELKEKE